MFDLGWIEISFVAIFALLVVGPKDLPVLLKSIGSVIGKARRLYKQMLDSVNKLDREVQIASGNAKSEGAAWQDYIPPEIRNLPADFEPGSMTAEEHQAREKAFEAAKAKAIAQANSANSEQPPTTSSVSRT